MGWVILCCATIEEDRAHLNKTKISKFYSYSSAKESEFFNVISKLKKQVIIVTKSFLKERNGEAVLDQSKIDEVNGSVFRIEKKKPFDDKKLGTIQTVISKIK